jgi:rhamnogalacturonan endolyase
MFKASLLAATALFVAGTVHAEVTARTDADHITLNNGLIRAVVDTKTGTVTSFQQLGGAQPVELIAKGQSLYWDSNGGLATPIPGKPGPKKGYYRPGPDNNTVVKLASNTARQADVQVDTGPSEFYPFKVEYHFIMQDGLSGLYCYTVVRHPADLPAGNLAQTRFVFRTAADDNVFNYWTVGRGKTIRIPRSDVVKQVTDATFLLQDGSVKTKYLNSVYFARTPVYGTIGVHADGSHGIFMVEPFGDFHNGGPSRQGQTVHDDVLLRVVQDGHFGASSVVVAAGETWSKVYGPFLVYANRASNPNTLWDDVDKQLATEQAKWPYGFVTAPEYVKARGTVSGKVSLNGAAPTHAQVILSDPDPKIAWTAQTKGYNYWADVQADGSFTLKNVVPGSYTLYVDGADQPRDFVRTGITVTANQAVNAGTLNWMPETHGKTLWQLGTFDRTAGEFRNGDDSRGYQMFARYPEQFPNDVDFTLGKSDPKKDWNYAQWSWHAKSPAWHLRFDSKGQSGKATLTIGIASAQPAQGKLTHVAVALNGQAIGTIELPKTGTAGYRGGNQDSPYNVVTLTFDAKLIKAGANDLTLAHSDGQPFPPASTYAPDPNASDDDDAPGTKGPGQVMYDAVRLEVAP